MTVVQPAQVPAQQRGHPAQAGAPPHTAAPADDSTPDQVSFEPGPGAQPQATVSALARLVGADVDAFASDYWGCQPLLSSAASLSNASTLPSGFEDLFSAEAVDELVSERGLRTPFLRVAQDGRTLPASAFTAPGGVGATIGDQVSDDMLLRLFAGGATIVLQGLHRTWPPLMRYSQQLAAELGHPVQVNSYTTPPANRGFDDHYDTHDVFVLQIAGAKTWLVRPPVHPAPLRDQTWEQRRTQVAEAAEREPLLETTLQPGDCLYLPRGYLHSATALGGVSTHVTIGIHVWTRYAVAEHLATLALGRLAQEEQVRGALPLDVDVADPNALADDLPRLQEALIDAVRQLDPQELAGALAAASDSAQRPAPIAPLRQLRDADGLSDDQIIELRGQVAARLVVSERGSRLESRAGSLAVAEQDVATVRELLAAGRADVASLGPDLARQLLRAGMAVVHRPGRDTSPP